MYIEYNSFEWDIPKATQNEQKHEVSFKESITVFHDLNGLINDDYTHSQHEQRHRLIGESGEGRILVVIFTLRANLLVRIISARRANKKERLTYEEISRV